MEIKLSKTEFFNFSPETLPHKLDKNFERLLIETVVMLIVANIEIPWAVIPFTLFTIELFYRVLLKSKLGLIENTRQSPRNRE